MLEPDAAFFVTGSDLPFCKYYTQNMKIVILGKLLGEFNVKYKIIHMSKRTKEIIEEPVTDLMEPLYYACLEFEINTILYKFILYLYKGKLLKLEKLEKSFELRSVERG